MQVCIILTNANLTTMVKTEMILDFEIIEYLTPSLIHLPVFRNDTFFLQIISIKNHLIRIFKEC